jgi:hypothetical protein
MGDLYRAAGKLADAKAMYAAAAEKHVAFLQNHREVIAAFDFFTVPTVTFELLYCFFVIGHGRRRILFMFSAVAHHPFILPSSSARTGDRH